MLSVIKVSPDGPERSAAFQRALDIWDDEAPGTPLYRPYELYGVRRSVAWRPVAFEWMDLRPHNPDLRMSLAAVAVRSPAPAALLEVDRLTVRVARRPAHPAGGRAVVRALPPGRALGLVGGSGRWQRPDLPGGTHRRLAASKRA